MKPRTTSSLTIDAFDARAVDIDTVELEQLYTLSIGVGWPHRPEDWQFLREMGYGIVVHDEIGRVLGSAMWFPHGTDFATVGMVITSPRLQELGTARWLMKRVQSACRGRNLRLNATRAAHKLYRSLGFRTERTVFQRQGEARSGEMPGPLEGAELRRLDAGDLPAIAELDAQAFGASRRTLLAALLPQSVGFALYRHGRLEAFALCRPFGRGHVVGPVVASNDADAIVVIAPHVAAHEGEFLRLDTHLAEGEFSSFLARSGLAFFDTVTTMSLGGDFRDPNIRSGKQPVTYGLASQALG
ncbi:GNAT family N-acetyltransferase [Bradyrhizobium sp. CCGUVB1N3]|uniref:GNAT family N-acetyltransferase n=1 Tax=Bradyrhizobium sp. CCGUVB1N3 TaxID=2949629 RepID=UPI0020B17F7E|nr:GNAT family N-acetyltransferase [Bradyrhizobium sp. CCGUVB1N3]MCP3468949.1 GNAT family N-acetyltransferase [Bradyrhizobium sp. CCGUVB1N3]